jgi:hypothetical protein
MNLSYITPFVTVCAICFFNTLIKRTQNNFVISAPLFMSLMMLFFSLASLKKTQPKFSRSLLVQSAILAMIDFLILRFVLGLLLYNSTMTLIGSLSLGIAVINFLYARSFTKGYLSIIGCSSIFIYTFLLEKIETQGCLFSFFDLDTHILPGGMHNSFNLLYLIPLRIYIFTLTNVRDNANLHYPLSMNVLAISVFQIGLFFADFKRELALLSAYPHYLFIGLILLAPLCAAQVLFPTGINYTKFVTGFSIAYAVLLVMYIFERSGGMIFSKNALEESLILVYIHALAIPIVLFTTCRNLYNAGDSIFERLARTDIIPWL